jgi:hypothetical protein
VTRPIDHAGPKPPARKGGAIARPNAGAAAPDVTAIDRDRLTRSIPPTWRFDAKAFPGFYDASTERAPAYDIAAIRKDAPQLWKAYGPMFKRVGAELGVDPYALAAYCVFESYNSKSHQYNPHMLDVARGMVGAGIAATQAQFWKGRAIPGAGKSFPRDTIRTAASLRSHPEYSVRVLATEFKQAYAAHGQDLAKTFPYMAYPCWGDPRISRGNYGTQAQYVSRAYAFYQAFQAADRPL